MRHFKYLLEGTDFTILTDHKPLVHAFAKPGDTWSAKQQRHLTAISEFGCTINCVPGRKNPVANALSRVEINSLHLGIDYEGLAKEQAADPETAGYRTVVMALKWKDVPLANSNTTLLCDTSTGRPRPLVPASRRKQVFDIVHSLSHPSGHTTAHLMTDKFIWHGINKDVLQWARSCIPCQAGKTPRHTESRVGDFPPASSAFQAHPHRRRQASSTVQRSQIPPDDHRPLHPLTQGNPHGGGINSIMHRGPPLQLYQPFGVPDSMVERAHHSLKAALMARCTDESWKEQLPWVLLGLRTSPKANGNASPAEKVCGETLAIPREFFPPSADSADNPLPRLRELTQKFAPCHKTFTNRTTTYSPPALDSCAYVFIRVEARRPPLTRPYRGPHRVIRWAAKAYLLDIHRWEDRLKPAFLLDST
ncbi:uncharacterized protein [Macrobrachium rosenbergii]|uniref:uncharacterized protein n=1 Tax=Macrobrachium rosenbergii TaxID=79674 RepID=UPI0034D75AE1